MLYLPNNKCRVNCDAEILSVLLKWIEKTVCLQLINKFGIRPFLQYNSL